MRCEHAMNTNNFRRDSEACETKSASALSGLWKLRNVSKTERDVEDSQLFHSHMSSANLNVGSNSSAPISFSSSAPHVPAAATPGRRRLRRAVNELLLRELAQKLGGGNPLVADEMAMLFNPVPFGESHESTFAKLRRCSASKSKRSSRASAKKDCYEKIHSKSCKDIEMEEQRETWEVFVEPREDSSNNASGSSSRHGKGDGIGWYCVSRKAKQALKHAFVNDEHLILRLEQILFDEINKARKESLETDWVIVLNDSDENNNDIITNTNYSKDNEETELTQVHIRLENSYHRLIMHGLCQYYGLKSCSLTETESGLGVGVGMNGCTLTKRVMALNATVTKSEIHEYNIYNEKCDTTLLSESSQNTNAGENIDHDQSKSKDSKDCIISCHSFLKNIL